MAVYDDFPERWIFLIIGKAFINREDLYRLVRALELAGYIVKLQGPQWGPALLIRREGWSARESAESSRWLLQRKKSHRTSLAESPDGAKGEHCCPSVQSGRLAL
jgi:hypothetical protein